MHHDLLNNPLIVQHLSYSKFFISYIVLWWAFLCENHMGWLKERECGVRQNRVKTQLGNLPLMSWESSQVFLLVGGGHGHCHGCGVKDCETEVGTSQRQRQRGGGYKLLWLYSIACSSPGLRKSRGRKGKLRERHMKAAFLLWPSTLDPGPKLGNTYMISADKNFLQIYAV